MSHKQTCAKGHQWDTTLEEGPSGGSAGTLCPICTGINSSGPVPPPPVPLPRMPLPNIAGYEVLGELGRGGMGVVYKARQISLNRIVALKMIRDSILAGPDEVARFRVEAEAVARLQHPNIVQVHEIGEWQQRPYFSLEYLDGDSLDRRIRGIPQPPRQAAQLVETLAHAVQYAHSRGIVHRDLKPANVLLSRDGIAKITDFGLAKRLEVDSGLTPTDAILGTPSYMAPEQATGKNRVVGPAADVYALGALLYELLTGRPPFVAETPVDTVLLVLAQEPVPPARLQPKVPRDLELICLKCLEKQPGRRYASAESLAGELHRFLAGEPLHETRPTPTWERAWKWARRRPAVAALAALCLATATVGFGLVTWKWQDALTAEQGAIVARQAEESQKNAALSAQALAVVEKDHAVEARNDAIAAQNEATSLRHKAEDEVNKTSAALDRAETALYVNLVARANHEWLADDVEQAAHTLEQCKTDYRRWEWYYLEHRNKAGHTSFHAQMASVNALAFGKEGRFATGSEQLVKLWIWPEGLREPFPFELKGHTAEVKCVAFSADGSRLASGSGPGILVGQGGRVRGGEVKIWDTRERKELRTLPQAGVFSVAFSPDGKRLASAGEEGRVTIWNVATGKSVRKLDGLTGAVNSVAYSPDGKLLATGGQDGAVRLWNAATGEETFTGRGHGWVSCVAFSPDGKRLASSGIWDQTVRIWDTEDTEKDPLILRGHAGAVNGVAFSSDGKLLASASTDRTVRVWDPGDGTELTKLRGHRGGVSCVAFASDQRHLASAGQDWDVFLWDLAEGQQARACRGHEHHVHQVAFSPDGKRAASTSDDKTVRVWDTATAKELLVFRGHRAATVGIAFSPDGKLIASGSDQVFVGEVLVWEADTGKVRHTLRGGTGRVMSLAFSPDGNFLAAASDGDILSKKPGEVLVWDLQTGEAALKLGGHQDAVLSVAISPDGKLLASADERQMVQLRDARTGQEVLRLQGAGSCVAFSRDGKQLATGGQEGMGGEVRLWDVATGKDTLRLGRLSKPVVGIAFGKDDQRLVAASGGTVTVWDLKLGAEVLSLEHGGWARGVAFSADGRLIASAGGVDLTPGVVKIWDGTPTP